MPASKRPRPKHILIMRISAIGDVAMIVPLVQGLRQQYPSLKITVLSRAFFKPLFSGIPEIGFYAIDVNGKHKGIFGLYKLFKELRNLHIDAFADLHNVLRSKIIGFFFRLSGVPVVTMNKGRAERKELTALRPKTLSPITPIVERHAEVFKKLQLPVSLEQVRLLPASEISSRLKELTGEKKCKWIGIAPFAAFKTKMYPLELMEQVIEQLSVKNLKIFLFGGGEQEVKSLEKLSLISENCTNMAGKLSFEEELQLISQLDLMLSMDSGNGHLAAVYGVPVITIWGNTHPSAGFAPFRQPEANSITPDRSKYPLIPTSIYGKKIVEGYEDCMSSISPDQVMQNLLRFIDD